jgi:uroporphyrinogen-III synthase
MVLKTDRQPLLDKRVLVTRPAHQSESLCERIAEAGGIPVRLPALAIVPPQDPEPVRTQLRQLAGFDMGIFISRNAVEQTLELLRPEPLPSGVKWLAIGQATAAALEERGYAVGLKPEGDSTSEDLLALPGLQHVAGKRIAIMRGTGGRELLAESLLARGAHVQYIETYQGILPPESIVDLRKLFKRQPLEPVEKPQVRAIDLVIATGQEKPPVRTIDLVIATSTLILQNLLEMSGNYRNRLIERPLVVLSKRGHDWALAQGFTRVYIAPRHDDAGIVAALIQAAVEGL